MNADGLIKLLLSAVDFLQYLSLAIVTAWLVFLLIQVPVRERISHLRYRSQIRKKRTYKREPKVHERSLLFQHLSLLMSSISKQNTPDNTNIYGFLILSFFMGGVTFFYITIQYHDLVIALICGGIVLAIPYGLLWVRVRNIRQTIGNQLLEVIESLIHNYSAASGDIYQSLKLTHGTVKDPELKRVLVRLVSDLQTARNEVELRHSIDLFIYTTGTSWGARLGSVVLKGYLYQENILTALLTIQQQMINNGKMLEEEKTGAIDSYATALLTIVLLPASLIGGYFITRPENWFQLQFGSKWSMLLFIFMVLMSIISVIVGFIIHKPRNDL
jgi:hypothetical protein